MVNRHDNHRRHSAQVRAVRVRHVAVRANHPVSQEPRQGAEDEVNDGEDEITVIDFQKWEDELIFHEVKGGLTPWVFQPEQEGTP